MHPTTEQLLSLRDGNADATVSGHVSGCPACKAELDRLIGVRDALRDLPVVEAPAYAFERIAASRAAPAAAPSRWIHGIALAAAASVVMVVALTLTAPEPRIPVVPAEDEIARLAAHSQDLEQMLDRIGTDRSVIDLETASTIVSLEDRIAMVDAHLRQAGSLDRPEAERLWRQRVELMHALVGIHAARAQPTLVNDTI